MKNLNTCKIAIAFIAWLTAIPAAAGVVLLEADADLRRETYYAPSPVPDWCYWDREASPLPFQATNADGESYEGCPDDWLVHCDADSLVFRGVWPANHAVYVVSSEYAVDLTCAVALDTETRLTADRSIASGPLDVDVHTLTLIDASGAPLTLLGDGGPDEADLLLPPGDYRIELRVRARQLSYGGSIDPYAGEVRLFWSEPGTVADTPIVWGALKALYR